MKSSADLTDASFLLSCMRCEQLLHDGDRYCRACGQDQLDTGLDPWSSRPAPLYTGGASGDPFGLPVTEPTAPALPAVLLISADDRAAHGAPALLMAPPGSAMGPKPDGRTGRLSGPLRLAGGMAAVLLVGLALALSHDLYRTLQDGATRRSELNATLTQVEGAIAREDVAGARHALAVLGTLEPDDPAVQAKRLGLAQRVQQMADRRALAPGAPGAPEAVGVSRVVQVVAPAAASASLASPAPTAAMPAAMPMPASASAKGLVTESEPAPPAPVASAVESPATAPTTPTPPVAAASELPVPVAASEPMAPERASAAAPEMTAPVPPLAVVPAVSSAAESAPADVPAAHSPAPSSAGCHEALAAMALCARP